MRLRSKANHRPKDVFAFADHVKAADEVKRCRKADALRKV